MAIDELPSAETGRRTRPTHAPQECVYDHEPLSMAPHVPRLKVLASSRHLQQRERTATPIMRIHLAGATVTHRLAAKSPMRNAISMYVSGRMLTSMLLEV